jgi:hypothetical protein
MVMDYTVLGFEGGMKEWWIVGSTRSDTIDRRRRRLGILFFLLCRYLAGITISFPGEFGGRHVNSAGAVGDLHSMALSAFELAEAGGSL